MDTLSIDGAKIFFLAKSEIADKRMRYKFEAGGLQLPKRLTADSTKTYLSILFMSVGIVTTAVLLGDVVRENLPKVEALRLVTDIAGDRVALHREGDGKRGYLPSSVSQREGYIVRVETIEIGNIAKARGSIDISIPGYGKYTSKELLSGNYQRWKVVSYKASKGCDFVSNDIRETYDTDDVGTEKLHIRFENFQAGCKIYFSILSVNQHGLGDRYFGGKARIYFSENNSENKDEVKITNRVVGHGILFSIIDGYNFKGSYLGPILIVIILLLPAAGGLFFIISFRTRASDDEDPDGPAEFGRTIEDNLEGH